jgi:hypothetical protein
MEYPDNIINKKLYKQAKEEADKRYKRHGLYKSAFIQKKYQELGGKYKDKKPEKKEGIQRWLDKEEWVEVEPYLKNNKIVICGTSDRKGKACRPLKRANEKTPITLPELIKLHGKKKLLELIKLKQKDMDGILRWKTGKFIPSKK